MSESPSTRPPRSVAPEAAVTRLSVLPPNDSAPAPLAEAFAARLHAELSAAHDRPRQARLYAELAEIEERGGDDAAAARNYLAAFNAHPGFREPLEALVQLFERRRSIRNLGRLLGALVRAAETPSEKARALLLRAFYLAHEASDPASALAIAREAAALDAGAAETALAWLEVERLSARLNDPSLRMEALRARARGASDGAWSALLWLDAASLAAQGGSAGQAFDILEGLRSREESSSFAAAEAIVRLAAEQPGTAPPEVSHRAATRALSLELQATWIEQALADPARGDALGIPRRLRTPEHALDGWLRAAQSRRSLGEHPHAEAMLERALARLATCNPELWAAMEPVVQRARLRDISARDGRAAATLAARWLEREADGRRRAALEVCIAQQCVAEHDLQGALDALARAVDHDAGCALARVLLVDLSANGDARAIGEQLDAIAEQMGDAQARGRARLVAAYAWGALVRDAARARRSLDRATLCAVAPSTLACLARLLSAACGDTAWYDEATRDLLAADPGADQTVQVLFELVRGHLARRDERAARACVGELSRVSAGQWLSCLLRAYGPRTTDGHADMVTALAQLASLESGRPLAAPLWVAAAMRAQAQGDFARAHGLARSLVDADPNDPFAVTYLVDIGRYAGVCDAVPLLACAEATADPELAAALRLQAGLMSWHEGDRRAALGAFEAAGVTAPASSRLVLTWTTPTGTRTTDGKGGAPPGAPAFGDGARLVALEQLGHAMLGGRAGETETAVEALARQPDNDLMVLAALVRVLGAAGSGDAALEALDRLAPLGAEAATFVAGERFRIVRDAGSAQMAAAARRWMEQGGGLTAGLEWLASTLGSERIDEECAARRAIGELLDPAGREAMRASATSLELLSQPDAPDGLPLLEGDTAPTRLINLELAPPGCDPHRRATALYAACDALGESERGDAASLAGWSLLVAGAASEALAAFEAAVAACPDNLAAWEGLRSAAEACGDRRKQAVAAEQLGGTCQRAEQAAEAWEQAGLLWIDLDDGERAERALAESFARDATRAIAFEKLFRRVRERKDTNRLLELIAQRLDVTDQTEELVLLFWEQARALRSDGDIDGALRSLDNVFLLEHDHVGALALSGEIYVHRGDHTRAAERLAWLAALDTAPGRNRLTAGVAAADVYEYKLRDFDKALRVLLMLHGAKLSTPRLRERLARLATSNGAWREAAAILEELMVERPDSQARAEAARLAIEVHRDRLKSPIAARAAVHHLLKEMPQDAEGLDMLLRIETDASLRERWLGRIRTTLTQTLQAEPFDVQRLQQLVRVARISGDRALEQTALSVAMMVGGSDTAQEQAFAQLVASKPRAPRTALDESLLRAMLAPGDDGPIAELFIALGPTLAEALGPSLAGCGVTKRDRVDPRSGLALRNEVASWGGAFRIEQFELYAGGKDPLGVQGVSGEMPALVVGAAVSTPLAPVTRARIAREMLAMVRGTTVLRHRDETTIQAIVVAVCNIVGVPVASPPYAMLTEVEKLVVKAMSRKTKKSIAPLCAAVAESKADIGAWVRRALLSLYRIAALASGDVAIVLSDLLGEPMERLGVAARNDERAEELMRFVLSPQYLTLRGALGLETAP